MLDMQLYSSDYLRAAEKAARQTYAREAAVASTPSRELKPIPLCRALERLEAGDQIPVVVSGIYAVGNFYDPAELACRSNIDPTTCIEFSPELLRPPDFDVFYRKLLRVYATFEGILHGGRSVGLAGV